MEQEFVFGNRIDAMVMMYNTTADDPNQNPSGLDSVYYYCGDNLGSVVAVVDSSGSVVERYSYDAWGEPTIYNASGTEIGDSDVGNSYMFTAREFDILDNGNLKLQHSRHRPYYYRLGRWMTNDPLGTVPEGFMNPSNPIGQYKDGVNIYKFFNNNTTIFTDILGLSSYIEDNPEGEIFGYMFEPIDNVCQTCASYYPFKGDKWWDIYYTYPKTDNAYNIEDWGYLDEFQNEYSDQISSLKNEAAEKILDSAERMSCFCGSNYGIGIKHFSSNSNSEYPKTYSLSLLFGKQILPGMQKNEEVLPVGNTTIKFSATCLITKNCCSNSYCYACLLTYRMEDDFKDSWDFTNTIPGGIETGTPYKFYAQWNDYIAGCSSSSEYWDKFLKSGWGDLATIP